MGVTGPKEAAPGDREYRVAQATPQVNNVRPTTIMVDPNLRTPRFENRGRFEYLQTESDAEPVPFKADSSYVMFEADATKEEVHRFLRAFNARIIKQEIIPGTPDGSIPAKVTKNYVVAFNDEARFRADLGPSAIKQGFLGQIKVSSNKAATALQKLVDATEKKGEFKVRHIGLDYVSEPAWAFTEGKNESSNAVLYNASSSDIWSHKERAGGIIGNRINTTSECTWAVNAGHSTKVAVIDSGFLNPNEQPNKVLFGDYGYWTYDFVRSQPELSGSIMPSLFNGTDHGRGMSSIVFSPIGDNNAVAGVATDAHAILYNVDTGDTHVAMALNSAISWGARVANISINSYRSAAPTTGAYYQSIVDAYNAGIIIVAANGNYGDGDSYPAAFNSYVIAVSAHTQTGGLSSFTTGNANTKNADIYAAGAQTVATKAASYPNPIPWKVTYGTSGAAALVSGACALYVNQGKISNGQNARQKLQRDAAVVNGRYVLDVLKGLSTY